MNNAKRSKLIKALSMLSEAEALVSDVLDDEQESIDNLPENLSGSERYEKMEAAIDALASAIEQIHDASNYVEEAME